MSHPTILLIDFDSSSIQHARTSLTRAGYRVEVARDGVAGLEAFARLKPDLVLVEAMLPRKHGFEVCQEIKKTPYGKCTPILITSREALGAKYVEDAVQLYGCDEYVEKPVSDEELLGFCQRLLPEVVVSPPSVVVPLPSQPDSQRLDDLSEDELMQRLDQLIDRATESENEPAAQSSAAVTAADPPDAVDSRPLGEVDLVSFCERVFPHEDGEAVPETAKTAPPAPQPARERSSARLLNEEEIMGQLDALARNDPAAGTLARTRAPVGSGAPVSVESLMALEGATSRPTAWTDERRARLVRRTGTAGAVLVAVGLLLLAVARGRLPVETTDSPDFALAGPLATPPAAVDADGRLRPGSGPPALWDAEPAAPKPVRRTVAPTPKRRPKPEVEARPAPAESETVTTPPELPQAIEPDESSPLLLPEPTGEEPADPFGAPAASLFGFSAEFETPAGMTVDSGSPADTAMFPAFQPREVAPPPPSEPAPVVGAREGELVPIESVDTQPILIDQPLPVYDDQSRRMRRQGTVVLKALIDERGTVGEVQLVDGIPRSRLNDAAMDAVRQWRYRAATKDGVPVQVWKTISLEFKP